MPANILNLPDFKVRRVEEADHDYHVYAEVSNPPGVCTACDSDRRIGYGLPPEAEHQQEPPGPPKNYGADINTLIELIESGKL